MINCAIELLRIAMKMRLLVSDIARCSTVFGYLFRRNKKVNTVQSCTCFQVAQRAAQLQEALLHCGRFQDALESLLSWLIDTEDLVANQKPPSAEFKVVKAQIQEQKVSEMCSENLSFHWINENNFPIFDKA